MGLRVKLQPYANVGHGLPEPMKQELMNIIEFFQN